MGDPDMGDPKMGDPDMGDPKMGDPDMGDPEMGDPKMGDPTTWARPKPVVAIVTRGFAGRATNLGAPGYRLASMTVRAPGLCLLPSQHLASTRRHGHSRWRVSSKALSVGPGTKSTP